MNSGMLVAVDVGNSRIKLGSFADICDSSPLPEPLHKLQLTSHKIEFDALATWIAKIESNATTTRHWAIGSVNRPAASRLIDWLREHRREDKVSMLSAGDLPLVVDLPRPDMVGIDRLLDALAANRLRKPNRPAVVISVGSAITVDLMDACGTFRGGAILPGIGMSARALHDFTDLLPEIAMHELTEPPPALGLDTVSAMQAGLFWGAVGAIRELIARLTADNPADIFLTGGAGPSVARLLGPTAMCVEHLSLAGIALACLGNEGGSNRP